MTNNIQPSWLHQNSPSPATTLEMHWLGSSVTIKIPFAFLLPMAEPTRYLAPYLVFTFLSSWHAFLCHKLSLYTPHTITTPPNIPAISFPPRLGDRNPPGLGQCYQHGQGLRPAIGEGPGVLGDTGSGPVKTSGETWEPIFRGTF